MSYVEKNLAGGEKVLYRAKLHWMQFPKLSALAAFAFLTGLANEQARAGWITSAILLGLSLVAATALARANSEFAVTNLRVIIKVGILSRRTVELNLSKLESIGVNQGIVGRILDQGTLVVCGTGGTKELFPNVEKPLAFRRAVTDATEQKTGATAPAIAA